MKVALADNDGGTRKKKSGSAEVFSGIAPVSNGAFKNKRVASDRMTARGPVHLWRTGDLDIPCQVAPQQSPAPPLQACMFYSPHPLDATSFGHRSNALECAASLKPLAAKLPS